MIKLKYSETFVREAMRLYWWKQVGLVFPFITLLSAIFVIYKILQGDRSWFVGTIGTIVSISLIVMGALFILYASS